MGFYKTISRTSAVSSTKGILLKHFKDVSREFDEFGVNPHLCKLRLLVLIIYYVGEFVHRDDFFFPSSFFSKIKTTFCLLLPG